MNLRSLFLVSCYSFTVTTVEAFTCSTSSVLIQQQQQHYDQNQGRLNHHYHDHSHRQQQPTLRADTNNVKLMASTVSSSRRRILHQLSSSSSDNDNNNNEQKSSLLSSLSTPLDRPLLALVDFIALLIFAGVGKASHSPDGSIDIGAVLFTAFPFVLSWFATSPITGIYNNQKVVSSTIGSNDDNDTMKNLITSELITTSKGWIVAIPLGIVLRGIIKGYTPPIPFIIVTLITTLLIISFLRILFGIIEDFFVEFV